MDSLHQQLRSKDSRDARAALAELATLKQLDAVRMLDDLANEADPDLRGRALTALVAISPTHAISLALAFLQDADPLVRVCAIHSLLKLDDRSCLPRIETLLLHDPDDLVRSWAAFALGELGGVSAVAKLRVAAATDSGTDHEGRPIRETAEQAIGKILSRSAG